MLILKRGEVSRSVATTIKSGGYVAYVHVRLQLQNTNFSHNLSSFIFDLFHLFYYNHLSNNMQFSVLSLLLPVTALASPFILEERAAPNLSNAVKQNLTQTYKDIQALNATLNEVCQQP